MILGERLAPLRWPWCGTCSTRTRRALAGCCSTRVAQRQVPIAVSVRHLNRLRVRWHLNRRKGRPRQAARSTPVASDRAVVQVTPRLSFVGVHLFAHWLDQHDGFAPVVARLQQAIEAYKRRTSRRGLCPAASSRADATAPLSGPVFCPAARDRDTDRVRYPRASAADAAWPGLSQRNTNAVSGATRAHRCRRGADTCAVAGNRGSDHLCRWAYDRLLERGCRCTRARSRCWAASWRARKP